MNYKYLNFKTSQLMFLTKAFVLCVCMSINVQCLFAQTESKLVVVSTVNDSPIEGEIVSVSDEYVLFLREGSSDTIAIEKALIKHITNSHNRRVFDHGKYHELAGWTLSFGYSIGINELGLRTRQQSFQVYKLQKPSLGLGAGVGLKLHPGENDINHNWWDYKFVDLFIYGKYYLTNARRRLYIDSKIGYAFPISNREYIVDWDPVTKNTLNYTSGLLIQPGIGLQFSGRKRIKWGIKIDGYRQDMEEWIVENAIDGVTRRYLYGVLVGLNFYL